MRRSFNMWRGYWLASGAVSLTVLLLVILVPGNTPVNAQTEYTFYADVKPILDATCVACHAPGGIGSGKVTMDSNPPDAATAKGMADAVQLGMMPPWMPGSQTPPLKGDRRLTLAEIQVIADWAASGAPAGDPDDAPSTTPAPPPSVRADLTLQLPQPYTPDTAREDDYRCFVIEPNITRETYLTGYTIEPGQPSIVHHVLLFHMGSNARAEAMQKEAEDDRPGYPCFGGPGINSGYGQVLREGGSLILGSWTPGTRPTFYPHGTGFRLSPRDFVIMQVHYNLTAGALPDQTRAILQLSREGESIQPLSLRALWAPVEIPCPSVFKTPECNRINAIAAAQKLNRRAALRTAGLLLQCDKRPEDYTTQDAANVTSFCDRRLSQDALAVEVIGHMHTRGKSLRIEINPDTPNAKILLDIPEWDFHWQGSYQFVEPIPLKRGDVMRITCVWDNSRSNQPRYIVWGEGTDDEMCLGAVTTAPPAR
jgi:mono/diheme cytochrome c family protein